MLGGNEFGKKCAHGLAEFGRSGDHIEVVAAEHHGKCFGGLLFNGEGVGGDAMELAGFDGLADVFDAIGALVSVVVARSSVGDENNDFPRGVLVEQEFLGVA